VPVEKLLDDPGGWVHPVAGLIAFLAAAIGALFGFLLYYFKTLDPAETKEQFGFLYRLFERKWYFDELYSALLVRPALVIAHWCRPADSKGIDRVIDTIGRSTVKVSRGSGRFDNGVIDGIANLIGNTTRTIGVKLRNLQTGYLRNYIVFLVLAAI